MAVPVGIMGLFVIWMIPGLYKLIPIFIIGGAIWATYHVAKGLEEADRRRGRRR